MSAYLGSGPYTCYLCQDEYDIVFADERFYGNISTVHATLLFCEKCGEKGMNFSERVDSYNKTFPKYPKMTFDKGWIMGCWSCGNSYGNATSYYGAYPNGYLKKIRSLFPEINYEDTLHLFSGSLGMQDDYSITFNGVKFDCNEEVGADVVGDAAELLKHFEDRKFKIILADPPYQKDDAEKYGVPLVNKKKVIHECYKILKPGGFLVWMDERLPMYRKVEFKRVGEILITRSTNHRVRAVFIFQKVDNG